MATSNSTERKEESMIQKDEMIQDWADSERNERLITCGNCVHYNMLLQICKRGRYGICNMNDICKNGEFKEIGEANVSR